MGIATADTVAVLHQNSANFVKPFGVLNSPSAFGGVGPRILPLFDYPPQIRRMIYTINAIDSQCAAAIRQEGLCVTLTTRHGRHSGWPPTAGDTTHAVTRLIARAAARLPHSRPVQ